MKENNKSTSIGFPALLLLAFIVLKLCHVINWSWIWVISPLWISVLIYILAAVICLVISIGKK